MQRKDLINNRKSIQNISNDLVDLLVDKPGCDMYNIISRRDMGQEVQSRIRVKTGVEEKHMCCSLIPLSNK